MAVRFVYEYCDNVKYILTTNDDVLVNLWVVIKTLRLYLDTRKPQKEVERTIFCNVFHHPKVIRDPRNKW